MLREQAVTQLEDMLAIKMEEVAILQEQLASLSNHHVKEAKMVDPYGDSGIYTGQIHVDSNGRPKPHGKGTMKYNDGRVYVGEWDQGKLVSGRRTFSICFFFSRTHS